MALRTSKLLKVITTAFILTANVAYSGVLLSDKERVSSNPGDWGMAIFFFDVGQADSMVIVSPYGDAAMVDAGRSNEDGKLISGYLRDLGIEEIDQLYISHYDADHIGGLKSISREGILINKTYDIGPSGKRRMFSKTGKITEYAKYLKVVGDPNGNGVRDDGETLFAREEAKFGQLNVLGETDILFYVLSTQGDNRGTKADLDLDPEEGDESFDENPASMALLLKLGEFELLTTGDQTTDNWKRYPPAEEAMLSTFPIDGNSNDIDILKVPHHGSDTSTGTFLANETKPEVSIISTKWSSNTKLPKLVTLKTLTEAGSTVLITGNGKNESGRYSQSKHPDDDNFTLKEDTVFNDQGHIQILVSPSGDKYTVNSRTFSRTYSTAD